MEQFKRLIREVHRRNVWQVLVVYAGASWGVLEAVDHVVERFLLPPWVYPAAIILLLVGLPIVLGTALIREEPTAPARQGGLRDPTLLGDTASGPLGSERVPGRLRRLLTWPRAILGGVLAFTALGIVAAIVVSSGSARVTDASGAAGEEFEERAWIVVADFESPADEPELAAAVREALVLDLQQSQYVNVFTRSQTSGVLAYMERSDTATVDTELAREIAQREGLAAVLAGSISKLGGRLVLGGRVLQPATGEESIVVKATAARDRLVEAVEALSREIRVRLGESRTAIRTSKPLPEVTTRSLEALQSYARAVDLQRQGGSERALSLAEEAIDLDPEFAMAYRLAGVIHSNLGRLAESQRFTERAYELGDKLSHREHLHIEARHAAVVRSDPIEAIEKYQQILTAYPEDHRAANNLAANLNRVGDYDRAHRSALRAIELNPYAVQAYYNAITSALRLGESAAVDSLIQLTFENGLDDWGTRAVLYWQKVTDEDWPRAEAVCDSLLSETSPQNRWLGYDAAVCGAFAAARGRMERALGRLDRAAQRFGDREQYSLYYWTTGFIVQGQALRGDPEAGRQRLERALARYPLGSVPKPDWYDVHYSAATAATRIGDRARAERLAAAFAADTTNRTEAAWMLRLDAALALGRGEYEAALERDRRAIRRDFGRHLLVDQLYRAQAFDGLERWDSAVALYGDAVGTRYLPAPGGIESVRFLVHLPLLHRRLGEIYETRGEPARAAEHYETFIELWSNCDPELQPQVEAARRALERLGAEGGQT